MSLVLFEAPCIDFGQSAIIAYANVTQYMVDATLQGHKFVLRCGFCRDIVRQHVQEHLLPVDVWESMAKMLTSDLPLTDVML